MASSQTESSAKVGPNTPLPINRENEEQLLTVGERLRATFETLNSGIASKQEQDAFFAAIENAAQRFHLWAVNLGLYTIGHSSLEYRLGDAPSIYSYVRHALADLQTYLNIIIGALQEEGGDRGHNFTELSDDDEDPERPDCADSDDSEDSETEALGTYQDDLLVKTALENVDGIIDRLYRLAFKIRNPATRSGFTKAQKLQEIDQETGVDLIEVLAAFDRQHVEQVFLRLQKELSTEDVEEHFLVKRLAKANTRRRQQFKQWRSHRIKVESSSRQIRKSDPLILSSKVPETEGRQLLEVRSAYGQPAPSMPSTATRVDPKNVNLDETISIISTSTYARLSKESESAIEIPQLPKHIRQKKEFECPYCHVLCSGRTAGEQLWNHHVLRDLRPYICTYEHCKDENQQYDSFKQWFIHETNHHRIVRRCTEHPEDMFQSLESWREHIYTHHLDTSDGTRLEIIEDESTLNDKKRICPICAEETVTNEHVGVHLQQLALFALPRSTSLEDDLDSDDDDSAATAEGLENDRDDALDNLSFSGGEEMPPEGIYGVDFNNVGNFLADLDPLQMAPDKRHIYNKCSIIFNPNVPRTLDVQLLHSIFLGDIVLCVRFSSDGRYVALGLQQSAVIYEVNTRSQIVELKRDEYTRDDIDVIRSVCFDPRGIYLATSVDDIILIFEIESSILKVALARHGGSVYSLDFSPNPMNLTLLSGSIDRTVRLWDVETGEEILKLETESGITSVAFSPDGWLFAAGCTDAKVLIWDIKGNLKAMLEGHKKGICTVAFAPDSRSLLSGSDDKTCKLWKIDVAERSPRTFTGHKDPVTSSAFTDDGLWIISGSNDGGIHFWNPDTGDAVLRVNSRVLEGLMEVSPDGTTFGSVGLDRTLKIWRYKYYQA